MLHNTENSSQGGGSHKKNKLWLFGKDGGAFIRPVGNQGCARQGASARGVRSC